MQIIDKIKRLAEKEAESCVAWRRHLHTNPELSYHEVKTSAYIKEQLEIMGFDNVSFIGDTGVTTTLNGKSKGKTLMLRADIDALAIHEQNNLPFRSATDGIMHACGHDGHAAMLLTAAKILRELKDEWNGTIKILFQPAEEISPGGALKVIADGILKGPDVGAAIGQHVFPAMPVGKVGIRPGKFMASSDDFTITVNGKGGHAAMPQNLTDPVLIAANIIVALQQLVSRNAHPKTPSVLSVGRVIADGTFNVIPNSVTMQGTFRTMDNEWRERALQLIEKMATEMATSMGASCNVEIKRGYPYLHNDEKLAAFIKTSMIEYMGAENVLDEDIWMAAEDFAQYSHQVPAAFYLLGIRNEKKGITSGLHTPTFAIDEDALPVGAGLMAWIAYRQMTAG